MAVDISRLSPIIDAYRGQDGVLIPLLQEIQGIFGFVPSEAVGVINEAFGIPEVDIYGVLTFYSQFYLTPRGKHTIRACQGTACYIMGGREILEQLKDILDVSVGETTQDGMFTLETVACLGCCGMAPVINIDDKLHGKSSITKSTALLEECRCKT
jgi:NADH:ubiquinone oxidoreductase subunit E